MSTNPIPTKLLKWYSSHKRSIPWRETQNPYFIWLSEVIMQQTRVEQGTPYYLRYIEKYPTLLELANAPDDEMMKLWQGLGYYSRARNMLAAARQIRDEFGGVFPMEYKHIRALKGVGEYTAAAIASIAFNQNYAAIDGNVLRVLSRFYGEFSPIDSSIGKKRYAQLADELLNKEFPGEFNQAMMELGATVCKPRQPLCNACPISAECVALSKNLQAQLPIKAGKTKVTKRLFHYLVLSSQGKTLLKKRSSGDIWQGLYEFPLIEGDLNEMQEMEQAALWCKEPFVLKTISNEIKHLLSHRELRAKFYSIETDELIPQTEFTLVNWSDFENYPVSRLIERWRGSSG